MIGNLLSPVVMVRLPETVLVALSGKELVIGGESKVHVAGGCSCMATVNNNICEP